MAQHSPESYQPESDRSELPRPESPKPESLQQESYKYYGFISYSHQDKKWGDWLHKSLETYRVPRRLAGTIGRDGTVPKRVFPIFRDREELPGSSDLGDNINEALRQSLYLIVICSPRSAKSLWVNEEIKFFKSLGREHKLLCLIVDGEPNASDKPELGLEECFPEAVRFRVDSNRLLTAERTEPIAADARPDKDGRGNAKLKILSGLLGVNYDALRQRDKRRRFWRRIQLALGMVALISALIAVWTIGQQKAAENARRRELKQAELMIEKAREARFNREEGVAMLYGAHAVKHAYAAQLPPPHKDFLASLYLPALLKAGYARIGPGGAFALDPQNRMLATASGNNILLFDTEKRQKTAELSGHNNPVTALSYNSGTKKLVSADSAGVIQIWDLARQAATPAKTHHRSAVTAMALTGASSLLATGSRDGEILVTDLKDNRTIRTFKTPGGINAIAFGAGTNELFTSGRDRSLRRFRLDTGDSDLLSVFDEAVMSLACHPDGQLLALGSWDQTVKLWDLNRLTEIAVLESFSQAVEAIAFSPDGTWIAAGHRGGSVRLWNIQARALLVTLPGHVGPIRHLQFAGAGQHLYSADEQGTIRQWRLAPQTPLFTLAGHTGAIRGVAFQPAGRLLASGGDDQTVHLWDVETRRKIDVLAGHTDHVRAIAFSRDGQYLASAGRDRTARIWNMAQHQTTVTITGHDGWIMALDFSPDDTSLATASWDKTMRLWRTDTGKALRIYPGHTAEVSGVSFSPDGKTIATAGYDGTVRLWDILSGRPKAVLAEHQNFVRVVALSPDGKLVASGSGSPESLVRIWDSTGKALVATFKPYGEAIWALAFHPDGRYLATGARTDDGWHNLQLWNPRTGEEIAWLPGHPHFTLAVAFSADGRLLASGGVDTHVRIWDVSDPKRLFGKAEQAPLRHFLRRETISPADIEDLIARVESATGLDLATLRASSKLTRSSPGGTHR